MIKLLALAMDGTFLNEGKKIPNLVVYLDYTLRSETNKSQYCY